MKEVISRHQAMYRERGVIDASDQSRLDGYQVLRAPVVQQQAHSSAQPAAALMVVSERVSSPGGGSSLVVRNVLRER